MVLLEKIICQFLDCAHNAKWKKLICILVYSLLLYFNFDYGESPVWGLGVFADSCGWIAQLILRRRTQILSAAVISGKVALPGLWSPPHLCSSRVDPLSVQTSDYAKSWQNPPASWATRTWWRSAAEPRCWDDLRYDGDCCVTHTAHPLQQPAHKQDKSVICFDLAFVSVIVNHLNQHLK